MYLGIDLGASGVKTIDVPVRSTQSVPPVKSS